MKTRIRTEWIDAPNNGTQVDIRDIIFNTGNTATYTSGELSDYIKLVCQDVGESDTQSVKNALLKYGRFTIGGPTSTNLKNTRFYRLIIVT